MSNGRAFGSFAHAKSEQGTRHGDLWKVSQGWENGLTIDDALGQMIAKRKNTKPIDATTTEHLLEQIANQQTELIAIREQLKAQAMVIARLLPAAPQRSWVTIEEAIGPDGVALSPQAMRYQCRHHDFAERVKGRWRIYRAKFRRHWAVLHPGKPVPPIFRD
jgi:hypothetical protein